MALHTIRCAECHAPFEAVNGYASTCSHACRARRSRARAKGQKAALAAEVARAAALLASMRAASAVTPED